MPHQRSTPASTRNKDANNPFTKSKYATLNSIMDSCREALLERHLAFVSIRFPPNRVISGWSRNSPMPNLDNGSRALRWFLFPRQTPRRVGISMTYMRRYALSAMLGIVTEEDTDGEFALDKPNRLQRQKNAVTVPQRGKTIQDDSGQAKISSASNRTPEGLSNLPHLDGISYQIVSAQDGRECIRYRKHGGEKEQLLGGGVSLEPATKKFGGNTPHSTGAVLMGQLLLFWLHKKEGRMDTITNTGAEGLLSILRHGLERHAEQRTAIELGIVHGMSGCLVSAGCSTAHGPRLQTNSSPHEYGDSAEALRCQLRLQGTLV